MEPERRATETDRTVVDALSESIVPLTAVEPTESVADLEPIGDAIGDADIVGLGEASHGTREFFQFKHRLFRFLVEEHDVRTLGLEANFAAMLDVNEYVVDGVGTARDALCQESIHGVYRTESVLDLIEWCRSFNEDCNRKDRIRLYGIDVQDAAAPAERLSLYLERVDPDLHPSVESELGALRTNGLPDGTDDEDVHSHLEARDAVVTTLERAFDDREAAYVDATSRPEYERASRLVWTLDQGSKQYRAIAEGRTESGAHIRIRDSAMAAQAQWLLAAEPSDRMALWGHNAHLARDSLAIGQEFFDQRLPSLGSTLAELDDIGYFALGLTLGGGSVRSHHQPTDEYRAYEIEAPPADSLPAVFGAVDPSVFFLDFAPLPTDSPLSDWLASGPPWFEIVGTYQESPVTFAELSLHRQFDGLVFIGETTAARPL